jgi:predicted methyltransferase
MLIKDQQLDAQEFKKFYKQINWQKLPRQLNKNHSDYFYIGQYEDDEKIIGITLRPNKAMQVSESFKGYSKHGKKLPKNSKEKKVNWGTTVQLRVDQKTFDKIKEIAKEKPKINTQFLTWD